MLSWLMNLIRKKSPTPTVVHGTPAAPGRSTSVAAKPGPQGIPFDPALVQQLKNDHRALLTTYGSIKTAASQHQWSSVQAELAQFRSSLTSHLMTESIKLYVYLQLSLAADRQRLQLMRKFSSEMVGIGKTVLDVLDEYQDVSLHVAKQSRFLEVWNEIGKVLGDRVSREESMLYPMYNAHHARASVSA